MNELAAYENKLTIGCFNFDKTGLVVNGDPTFEEWKKCGEFLKQAEKSVQFWIGDWLKLYICGDFDGYHPKNG